MNLSEIFIKRPVMTGLLMIGILTFGIIGYRALPVAAPPTTSPRMGNVAIHGSGASVTIQLGVFTFVRLGRTVRRA